MEEDEFKDWLVGFWKNNSKARKEMLSYPNLNDKSTLQKAAGWFMLSYGWRLE